MKGIIVEKDGTIRLADDIPMPEPGPYEALVKIESCMICNGTDMEIIRENCRKLRYSRQFSDMKVPEELSKSVKK